MDLPAETTDGFGTGFNREPGGTLKSMTTGGNAYNYLTEAFGSVTGNPALGDLGDTLLDPRH
ncbi:hypothetical protein ABZ829_30775 [Streptomyces xanthochromogenes]|uniref:hypothetical protein n=1 Tax=Streptomyces xanthochromogenes TaxID=67384 RepID=UPI003425680E